MTVVVDASAVAAALVDGGPDGTWARAQLRTSIAAPAHVFVEVSSVLRRASLAGELSGDVAALAHREVVQLPLVTYPFEPLAQRVWELHRSVTPYDAAYVALAEALDAPLITLDRRLARANGPACEFRLPD